MKITSIYDPSNLFGLSCYLVTLFAVIMIVITIAWLSSVTNIPAQPLWYNNYDAKKGFRKSLLTYLASIKQDPAKINITQIQVATANYGALLMETKSPSITGYFTPYHGSVTKDAVRLQINAGARAIIFDIWPDPSNLSNPVIGATIDNDGAGRGVYSYWKNTFGMKRGVSRYSNWAKLTRNMAPVGDIMTEAVSVAFSGHQSEDPFFIILNLHGLLTPTYLNTLGGILNTTLGGKKYATMVTANNLNSNLCSITLDKMKEKVFVIVNPDVPEGGDRTTFNSMFLSTSMNEVTNLLTTAEQGTVFRPLDVGSITQASYTNCQGSALKVPLPKVSLVTIQPSVGEVSTNNDTQYGNTTFAGAMKSGAQFVGMNVFSDDASLKDWSSRFGTYSFIFTG